MPPEERMLLPDEKLERLLLEERVGVLKLLLFLRLLLL